MILDKENKIIYINSDTEYIKFDKNIIYHCIKNSNLRYDKNKLGDINDFRDYKLSIDIPHVIEYKNTINVINKPECYHLINFYNTDIIYIKCSCIPPRNEVINFLKKLNLTNINIAEIGIRYSSTSKEIINNFNDKINRYDLFEIIERYSNYAKEYFKNNNKINIYNGDAKDSLKNINDLLIYDFVFFDASHKYDIDKKILDELIKHVNSNSIILFDDYEIEDVKILVDEFVNKKICETYIFVENNNIQYLN